MVKTYTIRRVKCEGFAGVGGVGASPQEMFELLDALRSILVQFTSTD